jgi:hypothetical protein
MLPVSAQVDASQQCLQIYLDQVLPPLEANIEALNNQIMELLDDTDRLMLLQEQIQIEELKKTRYQTLAKKDPCKALAQLWAADDFSNRYLQVQLALVEEEGLAAAGEAVSARDLQQRTSIAGSDGAVLAGSDAAGSVMPVPMASASLGALGTSEGSTGISSISLNPATLLGGGGSTPGDNVKWTRFSDLQVLYPLASLEQDFDGSVDYVGVRFHINLAGLKDGEKLQGARQSGLTDAEESIRAAPAKAVKHTIAVGDALALDIAGLAAYLRSCTDVAACYQELLRGKIVFARKLTDEAIDAMRDEVAQARREADAFSFGFNGFSDFGDPSLGAVRAARGTRFGLGFGLNRSFARESDEQPEYGFAFAGGLRYTDLDSITDALFGVELGASFLVAKPMNDAQSLQLRVGLDTRLGNPANASGSAYTDRELSQAFITDYVMFTGSIFVPLGTSLSVAANLGIPIRGDGWIGDQFGVRINYTLPLPDSGGN